MILTELLQTLQTPYRPARQRRLLKRKLTQAQRRTKRFILARLRRARTVTRAVIRRQYFLTTAYTDLKTSVRLNEDIALGSLITIGTIGFSAAVLLSELAFIFYRTAYELSELTGISMFVFAAIATSVLAVLAGWIMAFMLNSVSISIMEGATRKVHRSLRATLRRSLAQASRIASAWLLVLLAIAAPLGLAAGVALLWLSVNPISLDNFMVFAQAAIITSLAWVILMLINYSLVPIVALFEPKLDLGQTFGRSRSLVNRRGRLFILALHGAFVLTVGALYLLAAGLERVLGIPSVLLLSIGIFAAIVVNHSLLTTLYRKRRLARS